MLKWFILIGGSDTVLSEIGTKQNRKLLQSSLLIHLYVKKGLLAREFVLALFCGKGL